MTNICLCAKMYSYQATLNTEAETRNSDGRESLLKSISLIDVIRFANSPKLVKSQSSRFNALVNALVNALDDGKD